MFRLRLRLPSPALVIAMIALALVLGGTAIAASTSTPLTKATGTKLIKKLAPTLSVKHATTAKSASTVTGQGKLASHQTEIGIIGGRFQNGANANSPLAISTTFPLMAPVALNDAHIEVAPSAHCAGSISNPTAAAGFVCIYPDVTVFANTISGNTGVTGDTKLGFQMEWNATTANTQSSVRAEWAYTAP